MNKFFETDFTMKINVKKEQRLFDGHYQISMCLHTILKRLMGY